MDKRVKYTIKQQESSVRSVVEGRESIKGICRQLGCHQKTLQRWVKLYVQHGPAGLRFRHGSYRGEFKLKVIQHMLDNDLTISEVAAIFGVPNDHTVGRWLKLYQQQGAGGLLNVKKRGRKPTMKTRKSKKNKDAKDTVVSAAAKRLAALQAENEYLRAENEFLKKLDALIKEEEAAKARWRQFGPSKD